MLKAEYDLNASRITVVSVTLPAALNAYIQQFRHDLPRRPHIEHP